MQGLNTPRLRSRIGLLCVLLGITLLTLSFSSFITGCADATAYANGEETGPPAPLPGTPAKEPAQPAGKERSDSDEVVSTVPEEAEKDEEIVGPVQAQSAEDADAATVPVPPEPQRSRGRRAQQRPQAAEEEQAAAEREAADERSAAGLPALQPGDGNSGFAELEQGWPASSAETRPDSADAEQQLAPNTPLSDEARAFAGRWTAAVINKDGAARLLANEDEWVFNLGLDARCTARQKLDGKHWEQSGWWQLQGETLTLSLGPGGVWVFAVQRDGDDVAVWARAVERTGGAQYTLFCVRGEQGRMPPGVAARYNSDFGPLRFEPSGPGHWRASYGDPLGKLNVARVGSFLAGSWEQQPGMGFVLFRLAAEGNAGAAQKLDGVWWYSGSTAFDGKWAAVQAR